MKATTLSQLHQEAVDAILATPVQDKSSPWYMFTFLNRRKRTLNNIHANFVLDAAKLGLSDAQIKSAWQDCKNTATLASKAAKK